MKNLLINELAVDFFNVKSHTSEIYGDLSCDGSVYVAANGEISATAKIEEIGFGVYRRTGSVKNTSDKPITLSTLASRFTLLGVEYEALTQYNGWQHESSGAWQELITTVSASCNSVRSSLHAAPFLALWNRQTSRGVAFHIIPYSTWEIKASRQHRTGEWADVVVEAGVLSENFRYTLNPGEQLSMPEIIFYEFKSKTDLDCHKLHLAMNKTYPRSSSPVIYNSWLYKFDKFSYDDLLKQLAVAKRIGVECFVVDAGWFGTKNNWWSQRGDWVESTTFGFKGRMCEFADAVRAAGLKFGFWLEPESAFPTTEIMTSHPEYFLKNHDGAGFYNFADDAAREHIVETASDLITRYGAEFVKFDFNADNKLCLAGDAFIGYFGGYVKFINALRERHPTLHIENCASGGIRLGLRDGRHFDSFWLSDNQSPYYSHEIFKNTVKRMPPSWLCPYATFRSVSALAPSQAGGEWLDKIIACNDATWGDVRGVKESYLRASMTGGLIGLSAPLTEISDTTLDMLRDFIAEYKKNRAFWQSAACHILTDTETLEALEYRDEDLENAEICIRIKRVFQSGAVVYPVLDPNARYAVDGEGDFSGQDLMDEGIKVTFDETFTAKFIKITKK